MDKFKCSACGRTEKPGDLDSYGWTAQCAEAHAKMVARGWFFFEHVPGGLCGHCTAEVRAAAAPSVRAVAG